MGGRLGPAQVVWESVECRLSLSFRFCFNAEKAEQPCAALLSGIVAEFFMVESSMSRSWLVASPEM
jgi:hypothetical protein